jgi:hypothetical protein
MEHWAGNNPTTRVRRRALPLLAAEPYGSSQFFWSPDSRFLAFDAGGNQGLSQGTLATLYPWWALTPDGKRFLFLAPATQSAQAPIAVVLNWQAGLRK